MDEPVSVHVEHRPAAHLRPYVASAVGYELRGLGPGVHRGLPSRHLTVVVTLEGEVDMVAMPDPSQPPMALAALAGGLHARPVSIRHDGNQHGVQLHLTPLGARALFGLPAAELAWMVVPLDAVLAPAGELVDRLAAATSWPVRFAALDAVLTGALRASRPRPPRAEVAHAYARLVASVGGTDVASLAREVGWSRRHLAQEFRREYGLPPKSMARVLRFERSRGMLSDPRRPSLAAVAAACGWADQAHMTRDWSEIAGASPAAWLAAEVLPFVQDDEVPRRAR